MIVVHPYGNSTRFLHLVYENLPEVRFFSRSYERDRLLVALRSAPREEPVLLLGRGTPYGLAGGLLRDGDAPLLRDRPNLIGIWNMASTFAFRHGLKGLFSGTFLTEPGEAFCEGIKDDLETNNWDFAGRLGDLLRGGFSLPEIAEIMTEECYQDSALTRCNYSRLTLRIKGNEPLPVEEDYWGYDEQLVAEPRPDGRPYTDGEVVERGLSEIRANWQNDFLEETMAGIDPDVGERASQMSEVCLAVLLEDPALKAAAIRPGARVIAEEVSRALGERVVLQKRLRWRGPTYFIRLPGHDYLLWQQGEKRDTYCSWDQGEAEEPVRISVGPEEFAGLLGRFHFEILPMIDWALEKYRTELKRRVMIGRIREAATPPEDSPGMP